MVQLYHWSIHQTGENPMTRSIVVSLGIAALLSVQALAAVGQTKKTVDVIYLKSGLVVKGTILETVPKKSVRIQTLEGNVKTYKMSAVKKVAKETITVQEKNQPAEAAVNERQPQEQPPALAIPAEPGQDQAGSQDLSGASSDPKSPTLAFALSFVCPGVGQYYNGDITKGIIQTALTAGGIVLALTAGEESEFVKDSYYYASYGYWRDYRTNLFYVGLGIAGAAWLWSVIDAPVSASSINDEYRAGRFGHMLEMGGEGLIVGVDPGATRQGVGVKLVVHF